MEHFHEALARFCVVFNCSDELDVNAMAPSAGVGFLGSLAWPGQRLFLKTKIGFFDETRT